MGRSRESPVPSAQELNAGIARSRDGIGHGGDVGGNLAKNASVINITNQIDGNALNMDDQGSVQMFNQASDQDPEFKVSFAD